MRWFAKKDAAGDGRLRRQCCHLANSTIHTRHLWFRSIPSINLDVCFELCKQTDKQTDHRTQRHVDHNTFHPCQL